MFFLNNVTGSLLVANSLDRETVDLYSITVEATDGGDPALRLVVIVCCGVFTHHFTVLTDLLYSDLLMEYKFLCARVLGLENSIQVCYFNKH